MYSSLNVGAPAHPRDSEAEITAGVCHEVPSRTSFGHVVFLGLHRFCARDGVKQKMFEMDSVSKSIGPAWNLLLLVSKPNAVSHAITALEMLTDTQ